MTWPRRYVAIGAAALAWPSALVAADGCDVPVAEHVRIAAVEDGGSFTLADGRRVRLASIQAPHLGQPLAARAQERLASLVAGMPVGLALADKSIDRHGHVVAQAFVGEGVWLQQTLVVEGLARVQTRVDMRRCARALLAVEDEARAAKRGIWAEPVYRIRKPGELEGDIGSFQIVEGKVLSVAARRGRVFVNFGPDYRTDFTITISPADRKRLAKEGLDPALWSGKTVRVRGWLSLLNGPEIELTHPEQIQILE
jgi:endonuclease YncB( thermonuclease family)